MKRRWKKTRRGKKKSKQGEEDKKNNVRKGNKEENTG